METWQIEPEQLCGRGRQHDICRTDMLNWGFTQPIPGLKHCSSEMPLRMPANQNHDCSDDISPASLATSSLAIPLWIAEEMVALIYLKLEQLMIQYACFLQRNCTANHFGIVQVKHIYVVCLKSIIITKSMQSICILTSEWIYIFHDFTNIKNERFQRSQCVDHIWNPNTICTLHGFTCHQCEANTHAGTPHSTQVGQTRLGLHHAELCQICHLAPRHRDPTTWLSVTQRRTGTGIPKTSRLQV